MPLPLIIGGLAAVAGVAGVGSGIHGGVKMKEANDTMKAAKSKQERAVALFDKRNSETTELMDSIGKQELEILNSFNSFSDIIELLYPSINNSITSTSRGVSLNFLILWFGTLKQKLIGCAITEMLLMNI